MAVHTDSTQGSAGYLTGSVLAMGGMLEQALGLLRAGLRSSAPSLTAQALARTDAIEAAYDRIRWRSEPGELQDPGSRGKVMADVATTAASLIHDSSRRVRWVARMLGLQTLDPTTAGLIEWVAGTVQASLRSGMEAFGRLDSGGAVRVGRPGPAVAEKVRTLAGAAGTPSGSLSLKIANELLAVGRNSAQIARQIAFAAAASRQPRLSIAGSAGSVS